jgi:integrase
VVRNVADAADPPKPRTPEMQVWSPDQLRAFLNHVQADRLCAAWLLAVTTGMRRGEILGLRWSDLDLEAGRVAVRRPRIVVDYRAGLGAAMPPGAEPRARACETLGGV